jgi:hypothetical protein
VLGGGFAVHQPLLRRAVAAHLPGVDVRVLDVDPVAGAVRLATPTRSGGQMNTVVNAQVPAGPGARMAAEIAEQPAAWRRLLDDGSAALDVVAAVVRRRAPRAPSCSSRAAPATSRRCTPSISSRSGSGCRPGSSRRRP